MLKLRHKHKRTFAQLVVLAGQYQQNDRAGKKGKCQSQIQIPGIKTNYKNGVQKEWKMRKLIQCNLVEQKISQTNSDKGN